MEDFAQVMNTHYARAHIDVVQLNVVVAYSKYVNHLRWPAMD